MAVAAALSLGLSGCNQAKSEPRMPIPVRTAAVRVMENGTGTKYSASIVPYTQVDLSFRSNGYVESIRQVQSASGRRNIDQGDYVKQGTVLAVVSRQDYLDKLDQAKAQLSRAQAEYEKAKLSFDRTTALYSTQSATKPDLDNATAQLASTEASVAAGKAQVSEAQVALDYCNLKAPFDGWIVKRTVDVGSLVGPATNGITISDTRSVKAVFGVPDIFINRVKLGQQLAITTDALPGEFNGRVTAISPAADPKSRVYSVEVAIENPHDQLKAGMIASLLVEGRVLSRSVTALPLSAVVRDPGRQDGFAVYVVEGNMDAATARLRPVELGEAFGNMIAVSGGVKDGEQVVTTGATMIKNGDQIRIIP
jgi:multidrug efflux system membrane fusion protein